MPSDRLSGFLQFPGGTSLDGMWSVWMLIAVFVTFLCGCVSGGVRIESEPSGADVYVGSKGESIRKVGQTPLLFSDEQFSAFGPYVHMTVGREGYQRESVILPKSTLPVDATVFMTLKENELPATCAATGESIEKIARGIAESQRYLQGRDLENAERIVVNLISQYPGVSVLHDLLGNIYYLQKNLEGALSSYRKSSELHPSNPETRRMINKLEGITGIRSPASRRGF